MEEACSVWQTKWPKAGRVHLATRVLLVYDKQGSSSQQTLASAAGLLPLLQRKLCFKTHPFVWRFCLYDGEPDNPKPVKQDFWKNLELWHKESRSKSFIHIPDFFKKQKKPPIIAKELVSVAVLDLVRISKFLSGYIRFTRVFLAAVHYQKGNWCAETRLYSFFKYKHMMFFLCSVRIRI